MNGRLRGAEMGCSFLLVVAPLLLFPCQAGVQGVSTTASMAIQITKRLNSRPFSVREKCRFRQRSRGANGHREAVKIPMQEWQCEQAGGQKTGWCPQLRPTVQAGMLKCKMRDWLASRDTRPVNVEMWSL